jgi:hypothetical protein
MGKFCKYWEFPANSGKIYTIKISKILTKSRTYDSLAFTRKAPSESRYAQTPPSQLYPNHQVCRSVGNHRLHGTHDGLANRPSRDGLTTRGVAAHCSQPEATWPLSVHSCRTDLNEKDAANPSEILWCSPKPEAGLSAYLRLASSRSFNSASAVAKRARRLRTI